MQDIRREFIKTLSTRIDKELAKKYEKVIFMHCKKTCVDKSKDDLMSYVRDTEYNILGLFMSCKTKEERMKIRNDIIANMYGWRSSEYKHIRDEFDIKIEREAKPIEVSEGVFTCRKCGGSKTTSVGIQLRSADEPMTNFVTCTTCKNKWKC